MIDQSGPCISAGKYALDISPHNSTKPPAYVATAAQMFAPYCDDAVRLRMTRTQSVHRILIIDDDAGLTDLLREYLELEGFSVETVHDGAACLRIDMEKKDLVVLDVMLPAVSGFEVLKRLRQRSNIPVIMLTARDSDVDRIVGLELGADDYVPKPVNPRELVARIRAILRRVASPDGPPPSGEIKVGSVRLDAASRNAWSDGRKLDLTTAEFNLLLHLLRNAGRIVAREEISVVAFGRRRSNTTDRNVDTLVSKVRRKLGRTDDEEGCIKTIRNVGYLYAASSLSPQQSAASSDV